MKRLLTVDAIIEMGAGLLMVVLPSLLSMVVFGTSIHTPVELAFARLFGVAILGLGVACWLTRGDEQSHSARGVAGGMVVFNAGVVIVLGYAGIVLGLSGILLWPFILIHLAMAVWCVVQLLHKPAQTIGGRIP
jgi:hypothetical protein